MPARPKLVAQLHPGTQTGPNRRQLWFRYTSARLTRGLVVFALAFVLIRAFCGYALPSWDGTSSVLYPLLFAALVAANADLMFRASLAHLKPEPLPETTAGPATLELQRQRVAAKRRMGLIP